jgi:hypothetical protein
MISSDRSTSQQFHSAKEAYERVLKDNPNHAKVLQQVGWLYHHNPQFGNQDVAISYLMRSIEAGTSDPPDLLTARRAKALTRVQLLPTQTRPMARHGTFWEGATWHSRSTAKPTMPTSRLCTYHLSRPSHASQANV